jgi:hypothetical protein
VTNRTSAMAVALLVFGSSGLVVRALGARAQERELAAERRRAELVGAPFISQLAERIGRLEAEALALAVEAPRRGVSPEAGSADGYQAWLVGAGGLPLRSDSSADLPPIPAHLSAGVTPPDETEPPMLLGPLRNAAGAEILLAVVPIVREPPGRPERWLALAGDLRDIAAPIRLERLFATGYEYDFLLGDSVPGPRRGLRGATTAQMAPVRLPVSLGTGVIELALAPRDGWGTTRTPNAPLIFGLLLSIVLGLGVYEIARMPDRLRRDAGARVSQLEHAYRRLLETVQG